MYRWEPYPRIEVYCTTMKLQCIATLLATAMLVSCATSTSQTPRDEARPAASRATEITLDQGPRSLSETIRAVGEQYGGSVVAMHGIGQETVPSLALRRSTQHRYVTALAQAVGVELHNAGPYFFLYPDQRYAPLLDLSLAGQLPAAFDTTKVSLALGDGTQLFNALAILSNSLRVSLVADNAVADARCGELVLTDVSLRTCLEALLQSARVSPGNLAVHQGPSHALFAARGRAIPASYLVGAEPGPASTVGNALAREVRVTLPRFVPEDKAVPVYDGPVELGTVLATLSSQLGFTVQARGDASTLPINPCALYGVSARVALDLIVGQWLTDAYGYTIEGDGVVILPITEPAA